MFVLIAGLLLFLGVHSIRIFADDWRSRTIEKIGEKTWKGLYSFNSLIGLVLIVWGYGLARDYPALVWEPPLWTRHLTVALMAGALFLVAQNRNPQGPVSAWLGHPMMAGIAVWAFAHLMANGTLADIILFGSFFAWSVLGYIAATKRDRESGTIRQPAGWTADLGPGIAGIVLWLVFIWIAHEWLFGVAPLA